MNAYIFDSLTFFLRTFKNRQKHMRNLISLFISLLITTLNRFFIFTSNALLAAKNFFKKRGRSFPLGFNTLRHKEKIISDSDDCA